MNAEQAAKNWGCKSSWVRDRCKEGIIPLAEKKGLCWDIPEDAEKPACTRFVAVQIMNRLINNENGRNVELYPGKDKIRGKQILLYLSKCGFITRIKEDKFEKAIKNIKVTSEGLKLINWKNNKICFDEVGFKGYVNTPIVGSEIQIKGNRKQIQ